MNDSDLASRLADLDLTKVAQSHHLVFMAGYREGYANGMRDGMQRSLDMVEAAVRGPVGMDKSGKSQ